MFRYLVWALGIDGLWHIEERTHTKAEAARYVRACKFWDALPRKVLKYGEDFPERLEAIAAARAEGRIA